MKRTTQILLVATILLAFSCIKTDSTTCYSYRVLNLSGTEIKVFYAFQYYHSGSDPAPDTIIHIGAGEEKTLYVDLVMDNFSQINPETREKLINIRKMDIYLYDTVKSGKNFLLTEYWQYYPPDYGKGEFKLTVTAEDFNK